MELNQTEKTYHLSVIRQRHGYKSRFSSSMCKLITLLKRAYLQVICFIDHIEECDKESKKMRAEDRRNSSLLDE